MFGPWIETYVWLKGSMPDWSGGWKSKIPHFSFNFIMLHYSYMLSLTMLGSVILYGGGNLKYIDALFFASGAATQSGLNTVDINNLYLYQQVILMLFTCIATPIFIHTMVVFVRLYWFEKRFQHVVLEAQKFRRTRERTFTKTQAKEDNERDLGKEENRVGRRKILVMHPGERIMSVAEGHHLSGKPVRLEDETTSSQETSAESKSSDNGGEGDDDAEPSKIHSSDNVNAQDHQQGEEPHFSPPTRAITFADELQPASPVPTDTDASERLPGPMSAEQHITILENQRSRKDKGSLYIPGPREFDEGHGPQELDDKNDVDLSRVETGAEPVHTDDESSDERPKHRSGKKLSNKLSLEDAEHAFRKAKLGLVTRFRHQHDGPSDGEEIEKYPQPGESKNAPATPTSLRRRGRATTFASFMSTRTGDDDSTMPYLSYQATIGRNSAFVNLTEDQREELGGIEYRALKTLATTLVIYYVGFHLLGMVCLLPWIVRSRQYSNVVREDGINPIWWGFFTPASLFNDLGFTLTPDSMLSFQYAVFPLLLGSFLIVIGNTGFPCMLRFIIWTLSNVVPRGSSVWEEYRFLLDHPRRCFTLLFPSNATWWLFWILFLLNIVDLILFIILDLGDATITHLPAGIQVLSGWFQATSTRTAGFAVVNLSDLHPGVQVSYLIMMYISIFPIAISIRNTNVYEEKSLGVFQAPQDAADENVPTRSFVGNHLRRQLSFDLWYVFLGLFFIAIIEGDRIEGRTDYAFTLFAILFEVVSAYGTVGLSLGYPGFNYSFSGQFHTLSKLIIIAMQIRGRHRGLPYALDKAVLLPSEEHHKKEKKQEQRRQSLRRASIAIPNENDEDGPSSPHTDTEDLPAMGLPRTATGRSSISVGGTRTKRNGLVKLVSAALTAGPTRKED